jgi:ABC-2 type transport system ATP-binding protein
MRGLDRRQTEARIALESERFGLAEFLDDLTETYSHGMCQRLIFASALLHDPQVLVVDEPMVGLDPKSARLVKDLLRARASAGRTVFMSTHTLSVAEELADRIGIIDRGRLVFLGTLGQLQQESPAQKTSLERLFLQLTAEGDGRPRETSVSKPEPAD